MASDSEFIIHKQPDPEFDTTRYTGWDGGESDPGGVVFHNGEFHMFYNGMQRAFTPYSTGYATSKDGKSWTRKSEQPLLTIADSGHEGKNLSASSALVTDDGTWVLYLTVAPTERKYMGYVIRAIAQNPLGPWVVDSKPVLLPGDEGEWDSEAVGHASVNKTTEGYVMHYSGIGSEKVGNFLESHGRIGMAYSKDGIHWQKYNDPQTTDPFRKSSDPVFETDSSPETWEQWNVHDPNVQFDGQSWSMVYRSNASMERGDIGFATSHDGLNWQRLEANPIADQRDVKESGIWFTSYTRQNNTDYIWFEAGWVDTTRIYTITRDQN